MATIRLVPSNYARSNTNYVTVTNPTNMYYNTDHTANACTLRGRAGRSSNSTYYAFINGFDFSSVPSNATVTGFKIKIRAYRGSYQASGNTNYRICLASQASNSYKIGNTTLSEDITTSSTNNGTVYEIPTGSLTWDTLTDYGSDFSIDIPLRNSSTSSSNYPYVYVAGAEIEVTYTLPNPRTITTSLTGNGTISPSGSTTAYDGDEFELTITPTNKSDTVTATKNGTDITSDFVPHYSGGTASSSSKASGTGVTTGFNRSGSNFYQSSSTTSDAWLRYAIGHTAESPYSTSNTSNTYVKDGTNDAQTMGWMNYPFDFSNLPADAEITSIEVKCYGATESTTETASHSEISLYSGNTLKSTPQKFTSTSNSTITISDPGEWDRGELQDAWVRFTVGYYGGRLLGITWKVNYTTGGSLDHYTYTYTVNGNATIAVVIGSASQTKIYKKVNGTWTSISYTKIFKKVNGSWVETELSSAFDENTNYTWAGNYAIAFTGDAGSFVGAIPQLDQYSAGSSVIIQNYANYSVTVITSPNVGSGTLSAESGQLTITMPNGPLTVICNQA